MRGLGESLFHRRRIAFLPCQADIVGRLLVKTRRTGRQCRSEVDDRVERRVAGRKRVVSGMSVSVCVEIGGSSIINTQTLTSSDGRQSQYLPVTTYYYLI